MTSRIAQALLGCVVLAFFMTLVAPCAAESLPTVRTETLPPIATDEALTSLVTLQGRLLAIGTATTWMLGADARNWTRSAWHPATPIRLVPRRSSQCKRAW